MKWLCSRYDMVMYWLLHGLSWYDMVMNWLRHGYDIVMTWLCTKGGSRAMLLGGCQNCWGGASSTARSAVEQVRPRQREALAEGAAAGGSGGAKIGLLES